VDSWFHLQTQFIEDFLVLGVENIPDELVVNAHPVLEIAGFKDRVAQLLTEFGLDGTHDGMELPLLDMVPYYENIDPGIRVMEENARDKNQFDVAGDTYFLDDFLLGEWVGVDEEVADGRQVAVSPVEHITFTALLDEPGLGENCEFAAGDIGIGLGAGSHFGGGES